MTAIKCVNNIIGHKRIIKNVTFLRFQYSLESKSPKM